MHCRAEAKSRKQLQVWGLYAQRQNCEFDCDKGLKEQLLRESELSLQKAIDISPSEVTQAQIELMVGSRDDKFLQTLTQMGIPSARSEASQQECQSTILAQDFPTKYICLG